MAKHTPGPWRLEEFDQGRLLIGADGTTVETIYKRLGGNSTANAHLIAAAPELLDELKTAIARINDLQIIMQEAFEEFGVTFHMCGSTYDPEKAKAVLAKAEGR